MSQDELRVLRVLLKRPGNDACADCGGRFPRFASISLAVFLCNRCYGIHRSLGTHVTRTKSVGLDRWSADEVRRMSAIGNVVANSYWEENGPPIFQRPNADSPDFEVEKWIRDKYERKLFCSNERDPPSVPSQAPIEIVNPARSVSPQVKLLPRGALRCGPDCTAPTPPGEPTRAAATTPTPREDMFFPLRSPRPSQHRSGATLQSTSPQPGTSNAHGEAVEAAEEKQPEPVYDDDEFGDFVQA